MKKSILSLAVVGVLTACSNASMPKQTLSEQLQGQPVAERQEILRLACLNEAERFGFQPKKPPYSVRPQPKEDSAATRRLKNICRDMTDSYVITGADDNRATLAQKCGNEIKMGLKKDNPSNLWHAEKMKQICEEMTGRKIDIDKPEVKPSN